MIALVQVLARVMPTMWMGNSTSHTIGALLKSILKYICWPTSSSSSSPSMIPLVRELGFTPDDSGRLQQEDASDALHRLIEALSQQNPAVTDTLRSNTISHAECSNCNAQTTVTDGVTESVCY